MYIKAITFQGSRESNEDAFCIVNEENIIRAVVCDGVGSYRHAGEAAHYVAEALCNDLNKSLFEIICECHNNLVNNHEKLGFTTLAAVESTGNNKFTIYNVGDSRIYVLGYKSLKQLTKDHTNEHKLRKTYAKYYDQVESEKMARYFSVLEAALGHKLDIYESEYELESDSELLIIGSDGAYEALEKYNSMYLSSQFITPRERAQFLFEHLELMDREDALEDNATLLVIYDE